MYKLKAKFSRPEEVPIHPYFVYPIIRKQTKSKREIKFYNKLNIDEIKIEIKKHYKENNGKVLAFGNILYYEWYKNEDFIYKFDIDGNLIESINPI